jgi:hypothetical protein
MRADGVRREEELLSDLPSRELRAQQAQHVELGGRRRIENLVAARPAPRLLDLPLDLGGERGDAAVVGEPVQLLAGKPGCGLGLVAPAAPGLTLLSATAIDEEIRR